MHPEYRDLFLKNYFAPEERDVSGSDSATSSEDISHQVGLRMDSNLFKWIKKSIHPPSVRTFHIR
jgi:hypothetical protein